MILLTDFSIELGGRVLFSPINLYVKPQSITIVMGSSGIGKSSIINAINGSIEHKGYLQAGSNFTIFQDSHQLFPWFSIRKNLDLVCNKNYIKTVTDWNLTDLLDKTPNQISGGQRQRFTLIRAMYSNSELLLCDEPLSGLDAVTRYHVLVDFKNKINELGLTVFYITHDLTEAKLIADDIWLLNPSGITNINRDINEKDFIQQLDN